MTVPLRFNPSTQPGERATGSTRTCCNGLFGPGPGGIFPLPDETVAVEARSFARQHAWLGGIDLGYEHPFDELIYLPAVETHLRQVQSLGGYHDALACFGALGVGILR
jgi:hypothetical protein